MEMSTKDLKLYLCRCGHQVLKIGAENEENAKILSADYFNVTVNEVIVCACFEKASSIKVEQTNIVSWSDEDTKMLNICIGAVWAADYYTYEDKQDMEKWLNHLKERCEINKTV